MAKDYTLSELLVTTAAKEIKDNETVFAGIGIPTLGALMAKLTNAPNAVIAMEAGAIGSEAYRLALGIGDNACMENALCVTSLWRLFSDQQAGYFDLGMVGGAQVDKYGNLNSTAIFGKGNYENPAVRLPGSGGANDIACSANRTLITMPLSSQRFLEKVDYITSPGFPDGNQREELNLRGNGPSVIITDKCVFRFDEITKEMYLDTLHPGVDIQEVKDEISWELKIADDLAVTPEPTENEINMIRILDSHEIYTGNGLKNITFDEYTKMLEDSFEGLKKLVN